MKVFLSPLAEKKIQLLLEYLEQEWSIKTREDFLSNLIKKFEQISNHPHSCIKSNEYPNLHKCFVTKQTSFFYRIKSNEIEVITLIDNRQNPEKIGEEIKKLFG